MTEIEFMQKVVNALELLKGIGLALVFIAVLIIIFLIITRD